MRGIIDKTLDGLKLDRSEWKLVKFGDVAIQQKQSVDRENTELTRYVKGEHMYSEDLHLHEWGELTDEYLGPAFIRKFEEGDILYGSRRTYLRKVVIAPFDGITSNTTFVIKANEKKIDKRLLPFVMMSEGFTQHSIKNSKGSVNPYVNWKDLSGHEFLLPPKNQQSDLSELLWSMDSSIHSMNALNSLYKSTLHAFIREKIIEAGYTRKKIKELYSVRRGASPRPINDPKFFAVEGRGWIRIADVSKSSKYLNITEQKLSAAGVDSSVQVNEGDIVMSICASIGLPVIINTPACIHDGFVLFQAKSESIIPEFLYYILKYHEEYFKSKRQMGTQGNLNTTIVGNAQVPLVPISMQKKLLNQLNHIEDVFSASKGHMTNSKALQKSIVNHIF
jgi:type I restriction enzyme S subunit